MTEIRNFFANLFIARNPPGGSALSTQSANKDKTSGEPAPGGRTIFDTVTLSGSGQKIVNLARGQELAEEIRAAPVDKDFAANLFKAQEDIFRITRLFTETLKALFPRRRF